MLPQQPRGSARTAQVVVAGGRPTATRPSRRAAQRPPPDRVGSRITEHECVGAAAGRLRKNVPVSYEDGTLPSLAPKCVLAAAGGEFRSPPPWPVAGASAGLRLADAPGVAAAMQSRAALAMLLGCPGVRKRSGANIGGSLSPGRGQPEQQVDCWTACTSFRRRIVTCKMRRLRAARDMRPPVALAGPSGANIRLCA